MLRFTVTAALVGCIAASAMAADENDRFAIRGAGLASCVQFLEARETGSEQYFQFGGWMNGYLTALNRLEEETFDLVPWQSPDFLATALANYCVQNREQSFHNAVFLMAERLKEQRLESRSETVSIASGGDGQPIRLYQAVIERAIGALGELGFPVSPSGDDFNEEGFRQALTAFQETEGLPMTGLPDQASLLRLFYPEARQGTDGN